MKKKIFSRFIFVIFISAMILILTVQTSASIVTSNIQSHSVLEDNEWFDSNVVTSNMKKIGQWDKNYGSPIDAYIEEDVLFLTCDEGGLSVFNISDPANPSYLGGYLTAGTLMQRGLFVEDNYAYVGDWYNGFNVLDVSNFSDITLVSAYTVGSAVNCIDIQDDLAYIGADDDLYVVNISNPETLVQVGSYFSTSGHFYDIAVNGDYVYLVNYLDGLEILDASNLSDISSKSVYYPADSRPVSDIVFTGSYAIIATVYGNMEVIDVSNKASPYLAYTVTGSSGVASIEQHGDYLLTEGYFSVDVYDASVISSISEVGSEDIVYNPLTVYCKDDTLISMSYSYGIEVVSLSNILYPNKLCTRSFGGEAFDVAVKGNYAYLTNMINGLLAIDITDKTNPVRVRQVTSGGTMPNMPREITIEGDYAYVTDHQYCFSIYDLTDPTDPSLIYTDTTAFGIGLGSAIDGDYAFVASNEDGLRIYDTSNKVATVLAGEVSDGGYTEGVYLKDTYAYCADSSGGLEIIDISDVAHPVEVNSVGYSCYDVDGIWKYLLTLESEGLKCYLRIYDISNPTLPDLLSSYLLYSNLNQLDVRGDWAFISSYWGFEVVNWYELLSPSGIGTFNDGGNALGADIVDGICYVADGYDGLEILTLDLPDADGDRLPDSVETGIYGTNPSVADSDGDGLLDGEETDTSYTIPTLEDTDSDTFNDYIEWTEGSDPRDPLSTPVLSGSSLGVVILSTIIVLVGAKTIKTKRKRKN